MIKDLSLFDLINFLFRNKFKFIVIILFSLGCGVYYSSINPTFYSGTLKINGNPKLDSSLEEIDIALANNLIQFENLTSGSLFKYFLSDLNDSNVLAKIVANSNLIGSDDLDKSMSYISSNIKVDYEIDSLLNDQIKALLPPSFNITVYNQSKKTILPIMSKIISEINNNTKNHFYAKYNLNSNLINEKISAINKARKYMYREELYNILALIKEDAELAERIENIDDKVNIIEDNLNFSLQVDGIDISKTLDLVSYLQTKRSSPLYGKDYLDKKLDILSNRDEDNFVRKADEEVYQFDSSKFQQVLNKSFLSNKSAKVVGYNIKGISYETYFKRLNVIIISLISGIILSFIVIFLYEILKREYADNLSKNG